MFINIPGVSTTTSSVSMVLSKAETTVLSAGGAVVVVVMTQGISRNFWESNWGIGKLGIIPNSPIP